MTVVQPPIFSADLVNARPRPRTAPAALNLLESAHGYLRDAVDASDPDLRYINAHMAALRAGAAIVAHRSGPSARPVRGRALRSVWELLEENAPELREWAGFFAAGAAKRAAAEAHLPDAVSRAEADELIRDARTFVNVARAILGATSGGTALRRAG
ncbi:SAV_6107 family HEPN domain-containing protein [Marinactinospora thermotolerans]|uniref:SAV-6107-like HEPN domain-containing protein n=1 Tax=Marinactinospora thermotolerans DSM 45154 TaxID=1122192 RepID=A0A1T4MGM1_9ACTN|nr:SAV_6107 family HEPN domain-containing protein [Marinactinospora thermotolerans]SJZ66011.1 hypothetical protein SAMN02745673_01111 [Marinactinospora thermotolerans DSM 45154]